MSELSTIAEALENSSSLISGDQLADIASALSIAGGQTGGNEMSEDLLAIANLLLREVQALRNTAY